MSPAPHNEARALAAVALGSVGALVLGGGLYALVEASPWIGGLVGGGAGAALGWLRPPGGPTSGEPAGGTPAPPPAPRPSAWSDPMLKEALRVLEHGNVRDASRAAMMLARRGYGHTLGQVVERIEHDCQHGEPSMRMIVAAGVMGTPANVGHVLDRLEELGDDHTAACSEAEVRRRDALRAVLVAIGPASALEILRALESEHPGARAIAAQALVELEPEKARPWIDQRWEAVLDCTGVEQEALVRCRAWLGRPPAGPELADLLEVCSARVATSVMELALAWGRHDDVQRWLQEHDRVDIRAAAARSLGRLGHPAVIEQLTGLARDGEAIDVALAAVHGLARARASRQLAVLSDDETVDPLVKALAGRLAVA